MQLKKNWAKQNSIFSYCVMHMIYKMYKYNEYKNVSALYFIS